MVLVQAVDFAVSPRANQLAARHGDLPRALFDGKYLGQAGDFKDFVDLRRSVEDGQRSAGVLQHSHEHAKAGGGYVGKCSGVDGYLRSGIGLQSGEHLIFHNGRGV